MSFVNGFEDVILNALIGNTAINTVDELWVGLASAVISEADTNATISTVEIADAGYSRVVTSTSDWNTPSGGSMTNANVITFGSAAASYNITHFFLANGSTVGATTALIAYNSVDTAKAITSDDIPRFGAGALTITQD